MLINCPRCGFQQPKDTYCAQCGIDMDSFQPSTPPLLKRLFGSILVQLGLIGIIAIGISVFLIKPERFTSAPRFTNARSFVQISSGDSQSLQNSSTTNLDELPDNSSANTVTAYKVPDPHPEAREPTTEKSEADLIEDGDTSATTPPTEPRLIVYYTEVSRTQLRQLFENSRATGQFMSLEEHAAGIFNDIEKIMQSGQIKVLHKEERSLAEPQPIQWFYGLRDQMNPANNIGLATFFDFGEIDTNLLRGNVEVQRNWRQLNTNGEVELQQKSFPAFFEIGSETGFFLSGVLPRRTFLENEATLTQQPVYQIFNSAQFKQGQSEFVIFIEYDRRPLQNDLNPPRPAR